MFSIADQRFGTSSLVDLDEPIPFLLRRCWWDALSTICPMKENSSYWASLTSELISNLLLAKIDMSEHVKTILESQVKSAFSMFDQTGNATIQYKDFGTLMRSLGYDMDQEIALAIAEKLDEHTDKGCVTYSAFKAYFYNKLNSEEVKQDFRLAFQAMDIDHDKLISFDDLKTFLHAAEEERTDEQIHDMISDADIDGDGHINYEQFVRLMVTR